MNKCQGCIHWVNEGDMVGTCRRGPPVICNAILEQAMQREPLSIQPAVKAATCWPRTSAVDGCSEWESPMGPC